MNFGELSFERKIKGRYRQKEEIVVHVCAFTFFWPIRDFKAIDIKWNHVG